MKALDLLKANQNIQDRAENFASSIERELKKEIIDVLVEKKEKITDQIHDLKSFNLATDLNQGIKQMTREDCKERFKDIINLEFELTLIELELKSKKESFDKYFA